MSAVLLPFAEGGGVDWAGFEAHVSRTVAAGLVPAVNMDTGYAPLLDAATRAQAMQLTAAAAPAGFVGGAHVVDRPGAPPDVDAYRLEMETIARAGGTPIVFPSLGLSARPDEEIVSVYAELGNACERFLAFELGSMFSPAGRILSSDAYRALLDIAPCVGAKHSSLSRAREWERLALRDAVRPEFLVLTGNDLAIDMVMYGSDYLLGLSTFAPDLFARRDAYWLAGDARFFELNDALQYLGSFSFRHPVPGYRHNAAQFLHLRGWIATSRTHANSPARPDHDVDVLQQILVRLAALEPDLVDRP